MYSPDNASKLKPHYFGWRSASCMEPVSELTLCHLNPCQAIRGEWLISYRESEKKVYPRYKGTNIQSALFTYILNVA